MAGVFYADIQIVLNCPAVSVWTFLLISCTCQSNIIHTDIHYLDKCYLHANIIANHVGHLFFRVQMMSFPFLMLLQKKDETRTCFESSYCFLLDQQSLASNRGNICARLTPCCVTVLFSDLCLFSIVSYGWIFFSRVR